MIGFAADHGAQRDQRVEFPAEGAASQHQRLERERDLERARHARHVDVVRGDAELEELLVARGEELPHQLFVEAAPDDTDAQSPAIEVGCSRRHTAFTTGSSGETYSSTSRPKPDMLGMFFGRASTRILPTPRSCRICAPMPWSRGSHWRPALPTRGFSSRRRSTSPVSERDSWRRSSTTTPSLWCATMRSASCTEYAWRLASKSKRSNETKGSCTRTSTGRSGCGSPFTSA